MKLLRDKVRPGGAVHVSYNALPGWGGALGMARVLQTVGRQRAARSDRQAEEGFKFLRELVAAEAVDWHWRWWAETGKIIDLAQGLSRDGAGKPVVKRTGLAKYLVQCRVGNARGVWSVSC